MLLMLQRAIEDDSAQRHSRTVLARVEAARQRDAISEDAGKLQTKLRWELIPAADAAHDGHIVAALRSLDAALDADTVEGVEVNEVQACLHRLMVAVELAPAALAEAEADLTTTGTEESTEEPESIAMTEGASSAASRQPGRHSAQ